MKSTCHENAQEFWLRSFLPAGFAVFIAPAIFSAHKTVIIAADLFATGVAVSIRFANATVASVIAFAYAVTETVVVTKIAFAAVVAHTIIVTVGVGCAVLVTITVFITDFPFRALSTFSAFSRAFFLWRVLTIFRALFILACEESLTLI
jgi:hypothetical protein